MASTTISANLQERKLAAVMATVTQVGVTYFAMIILALHFLRPDLNPISRPTSAYAVGPYDFLMTSAFFSMSVASLALVVAIYQGLRPSARSRAGLMLLGAWAVGVLIAMTFPMDPEGAAQTIGGTIHDADGPPTFLCLGIGMTLLSWRFKQSEEWRPFYRPALILSMIFLAAFAATFLSWATGSGTLGIAQRIALAIAVIWMLLTAIRIRSVAAGPVSI